MMQRQKVDDCRDKRPENPQWRIRGTSGMDYRARNSGEEFSCAVPYDSY